MKRWLALAAVMMVMLCVASPAQAGRMYSSGEARFATPDPALNTPNPNDLLKLNGGALLTMSPYVYAANNPLKYVDPDGRLFETILDVVSVGLSLKDFVDNPTWGNAAWLAADVAGAALPFVPAAGIVRHAAKIDATSVNKAKELVLDTNVVISDGKKFVESGENIVKSKVTDVEINNLVDRGKISAPNAAGQIPSVDLPNVNIRINVRGNLKPGKAGNFADGIIGATAIERKATLITRDKDLLQAVKRAGGKAETP